MLVPIFNIVESGAPAPRGVCSGAGHKSGVSDLRVRQEEVHIDEEVETGREKALMKMC
jgi:hypothetical protein